MSGQGGPEIVLIDDDVDDTWRQDSGAQFAELQRRQRRGRGRLGDHGVSGEQCRRDLDDREEQRKVPRRNRRDDAERFVQADHLLRGVLLEDARQNGKIVAGGEAVNGKGFFVRPTIVRDIADDSRLVREEQFGPVLPVMRFSNIDDAIARANDTDYGLGGSVWSSDRERAFQVATRINSGMVWVNKHLDVGPDIPFIGAKQSGMGAELGQEGLEEFTQATIINMAK